MTEDQARALQRANLELARARRKIRKLFASIYPVGSTVSFRRGRTTFHAVVVGYSEDGEHINGKSPRTDTRYQIKPTELSV